MIYSRFRVIAALLLVGTLVACNDQSQSSAVQVREAAEASTSSLYDNIKLPRLHHSEELDNLIRRAEFINRENMSGCITLFAGNTMVYQGDVEGKVSSLNSYLFPGDRSITRGGEGITTMEAPDVDGAFGENADGIFWFDSIGEYHEWKGEYFFSTGCEGTSTQPLLVRTLDAND